MELYHGSYCEIKNPNISFSSVFEVNENNLLEIITAYSNLMQLYNN